MVLNLNMGGQSLFPTLLTTDQIKESTGLCQCWKGTWVEGGKPKTSIKMEAEKV